MNLGNRRGCQSRADTLRIVPDRHRTFDRLHQSGCFVVPNPWDIGTAKLMAAAGAKALATTSAGYAFTLGRVDGTLTRDEALTHAEAIVAATPLPVTGDLENGYADSPEDVAETVRLAAEVGLSGCSIEDMRNGEPYEYADAVARISAAVDAARSLDRPFVLCARADGLLYGAYGLHEAIGRIQAFEGAGADLLYIPGPDSQDDLKRIVQSVTTPVNALVGGALANLRIEDFAAIGVRRISIGSRLARRVQTMVRDAAEAMVRDGDFTPLMAAADPAAIDAAMG